MQYIRMKILAVVVFCAVFGDALSIASREGLEQNPQTDEIVTPWEFADGYTWTVSCWVQPPYNNESELPIPPVGGTTADCPPGVSMRWSVPPPMSTTAYSTFLSGVELRINHSELIVLLLKLLSLSMKGDGSNALVFAQGMGYFIPHFAMYGCLDYKGMACIPDIDKAENFMKIHQMIPPAKSTERTNSYNFTGKLALGPGKYMITANVNFFNSLNGDKIIMALGAQTQTHPKGLSTGVVVASVLSIILVVQKLRPQQYPKNMPAPVNDINFHDIVEDGKIISSRSFMALEKLGNGAYGEVFKGALFRNGTPVFCAIKSLRDEHRASLSEKFLREADVMRSLRHENIVRIIGICGVDEAERSEICILMEYLPEGDLKLYLEKNPEISTAERLWISLQIARGCEYIASKNLVHRDIAARNCLIGRIGSSGYPDVKIGDFGLARALEESEAHYVMEGGGLMPIRWMAIESIIERQFSESSDVWAYGVCVWEIFSKGKTPYTDIVSYNLAASIASGLRLPRPDLCPLSIFNLLRSCWQMDCQLRPKFVDLVLVLVNTAESNMDDTISNSDDQMTVALDKERVLDALGYAVMYDKDTGGKDNCYVRTENFRSSTSGMYQVNDVSEDTMSVGMDNSIATGWRDVGDKIGRRTYLNLPNQQVCNMSKEGMVVLNSPTLNTNMVNQNDDIAKEYAVQSLATPADTMSINPNPYTPFDMNQRKDAEYGERKGYSKIDALSDTSASTTANERICTRAPAVTSTHILDIKTDSVDSTELPQPVVHIQSKGVKSMEQVLNSRPTSESDYRYLTYTECSNQDSQPLTLPHTPTEDVNGYTVVKGWCMNNRQ
eukprot:CFRG7708T1